MFDEPDQTPRRVDTREGELLRKLEEMEEEERIKRLKADDDEKSMKLARQLQQVGFAPLAPLLLRRHHATPLCNRLPCCPQQRRACPMELSLAVG